ncbi:pentapeptide repeat-containing protein [Asanoa sp. WMMD1127]|uniref:pentapeptide repeat-containing protein n=1 Tax=Asanoa sp. WMMD1127 TaxID=3016107 RepID=UPI002415D8D7|nr:pentapeptide repeat-containing protein [Asanoa sp. WMMD1127]MDG4825310.1 pentapeptide repeat-containing protein [Asanoa sp. WMMD1127]
MPRRDVVDRWCTNDGSALAREILRRLAGGGPLHDLGLPVVDGLLDLRGLPAGGLDATGGEVVDADLRHCSLSHAHVAGVSWRGCRFDGADLSRAVLTGGGLTNSSLRRADLREALVVDSVWNAVELTGARTRYLHAERTTFTGTAFPGLAKVEFTGCAFDACRFTGPLHDVRFLGRVDPGLLRDVTFESSDVRWAEFDGVEFDRVTFPDDGALIVVPAGFRAVAERAGMLSLERRDEVGKAFRSLLSRESLRPGLSATAGWAIARHDLVDGDPHGEELADFAARMLAQAQR